MFAVKTSTSKLLYITGKYGEYSPYFDSRVEANKMLREVLGKFPAAHLIEVEVKIK